MRIEPTAPIPDTVIEGSLPREPKYVSPARSSLEEHTRDGLQQLQKALQTETPDSKPAPPGVKMLTATSHALLKLSAQDKSIAELPILPEIQQTLHMIEIACGDSLQARQLRASLPVELVPDTFAEQYPNTLASVRRLLPLLEELVKDAKQDRQTEVTLDVLVKGMAEDVAAFEDATASAALRELAEQQTSNAEHHNWEIITDENDILKRLLPPPGSHRAVIQPAQKTTVRKTSSD